MEGGDFAGGPLRTVLREGLATSIPVARLSEADVHGHITGREKHLYSIYKKMIQKDRDFDQIYDLRAVRAL